LLITDDSHDQLNLDKLLGKSFLNFTFKIINSISQAIKLTEIESIDLIISYYFVAGQFANKLLNNLRNTPILIITNNSNREKAIQNLQSIFHDYINTNRDSIGFGNNLIYHIRKLLTIHKCYNGLEQQEIKGKETLSEFVHILKHDMNNYLTAIGGFIYLLQNEFKEEYIERLDKNVKGMFDLLRRSVSFADATITSSYKKSIQLDIILKELKVIIKIPKKVIITSKFDPSTLNGNKKDLLLLFKQLLENILIHGQPNWIDFRGKIASDGAKYLIEISHDGNSITNEKFAQIIKNRNSMTKKSGLGLAIIKKIINNYGWELTYSFEDNAIITLLIPQEIK